MESIFCTVAARNYIAQAIVLGRSIHAVDNKSKYIVLLADVYERDVQRILEEAADKAMGIEFMCLDELVRDAEYPELPNMALRYDPLEYCTSLKPTLLLALARKFPSSYITYLDPDIQVFRPLRELDEMIQYSSIVLTPHLIRPSDGQIVNYVQRCGVYNLGFISVNASDTESTEILKWWQKRVRYECLHDTANGIFVDQMWCNFFPSFGNRVHVLRNSSYNIAYWNLHERSLTTNGESYLVNNGPLAFFHFSGYSPKEPNRLSKYYNALHLDSATTLRRIAGEYKNLLYANGFEYYSNLEYGFLRNPYNNMIISAKTRAAYRSLIDNITNRFAENPFEEKSVWPLLERTRERGDKVLDRLRKMLKKMARACKRAVPAVVKEFIKGKRHKDGISNYPAKTASAGAVSAKYSSAEIQQKGVQEVRNGVRIGLFGFVTTESGVGEASRGLIRGYMSAGIDLQIYDYRASPSRKENKEFADLVRSSAMPMDIAHVCVNADGMDTFFRSKLGQIASEAKYKIGTWYWELEEFPDEWTFNQHYIDEIWVATAFVANALKKKINIPIHVIPPSVSFSVDSKYNRKFWGIPEKKKVIMSSLDALSYLSRKNSVGLISVFSKLALTKDANEYHIVMKVHNLSEADERRIREEIKTPNITIFNKTMTTEENYGLLACADVYVSLHRSEGLGFPILEAMKLGIPVVATGYSGNVDYMNEKNSFMVPYKLVRVRRDGVYHEGYWAEPDANACIELVKQALSEGNGTREITQRAKEDIERRFSPAAIGERISRRLKEIGEESKKLDAMLGPWA
jgi:glycosyltransferase involved in cell wall biosynthesis